MVLLRSTTVTVLLFAVACGQSTKFGSSPMSGPSKEEEAPASVSDESPEAAADANIEAEKVTPATPVTGAYLSGADCGYSELERAADGSRTVGCRHLVVDLRDMPAEAVSEDENGKATGLKEVEPSKRGHVWQRYFEIPADRTSDGRFILTFTDANGQGQVIKDLSALLSRIVTDDLTGLSTANDAGNLTGNVYRLPESTSQLPKDFSSLTSVATYNFRNLDIAPQSFTKGFPNLKNLFEWFAIDLHGTINIVEDCDCAFKFKSDDGTKLFIDDALIIDHDGIHRPSEKSGTVSLTKGPHKINIQYFQGPRVQIALQFYWKLGSMDKFEIIPPEAFSPEAK